MSARPARDAFVGRVAGRLRTRWSARGLTAEDLVCLIQLTYGLVADAVGETPRGAQRLEALIRRLRRADRYRGRWQGSPARSRRAPVGRRPPMRPRGNTNEESQKRRLDDDGP